MLFSLVYLGLLITWLAPPCLKATGSAVLVYNKDRDQRGTGVAIGYREKTLFVVTAEHVVRGGWSLRCRYQTTKGPSAVLDRVQLLLVDRSLDLALLRLSDVTEAPRALASLSRSTQSGGRDKFDAWSVGVDDEARPQPRPELVRGKKLLRAPQGNERFAWECQLAAERGRSGGGLFDLDGCLIGICSGVQGGKAYYTHADEIRFWLRRNEHGWLTAPSIQEKPTK